jgi:hypothetical protein
VKGEALRAQAERCRRLLKFIYTPSTVTELENYLRELEKRAAALGEPAPWVSWPHPPAGEPPG